MGGSQEGERGGKETIESGEMSSTANDGRPGVQGGGGYEGRGGDTEEEEEEYREWEFYDGGRPEREMNRKEKNREKKRKKKSVNHAERALSRRN